MCNISQNIEDGVVLSERCQNDTDEQYLLMLHLLDGALLNISMQ